MSTLTDLRRSMVAEARRRQRLTWLISAVVLVALPWIFSSSFSISIMTQIGIAIIFALSYNMLLGQGGMLSFGHAAYFGLGGFLAMHAMNYIADGAIPLPVPLLPLIGGVIGLFFGFIIGTFSTRRAGTVFAMISLGVAELIAALSLIFVGFFGGEEGVSSNRTKGPDFFGFNFGPDIQVYYVAAFWALIAAIAMFLFSRTPAGRMANAVRDNAERAEFIGYSQRNVRMISFCLSGFFAGLAGGMFAIAYEIVTEETLNMNQSGAVLLMAYIGGVGYFIGPIIGAIIMTLLRTVLSNFTELWMLYVGLLFIATVMFVPSGLTGLLMMHGPAWKRRSLKRLLAPYAAISIPSLAVIMGVGGLLELTHFAHTTSMDDRVMTLFSIPMNIDSLLPWAGLIALFIGGVLGVRRLRPMLLDAWADANGAGGGD
ncbi:MAG: branched-chain amino acid ABC transporter permease [Rhodospirillales bacterium]|nr:branched-chain amino acid ABC transporter permease [Rhodospirillales bacterium]MCW8860933.1 branched-chain amino acid ABC transporter permease [Rhodospirillales bacterium]MCW8952757.1 branched-chain amino acid ABC transporter permease [Rhodospirillales bacterium]MCW8970209.1 branched-chain amino acid ABC transporter permease [Rhodospirillales bacterium]MCW9003154.1 branched-chain amino acid ABC transporter permease [Rhodospirillales bacterium]